MTAASVYVRTRVGDESVIEGRQCVVRLKFEGITSEAKVLGSIPKRGCFKSLTRTSFSIVACGKRA